MIKTYISLTKPGIIYGNAIPAIAGFSFAAKGHFTIILFLAMLSGLSLVIASGCTFNNYIDRRIDEKMERTKNRALVVKSISSRSALLYASILGISGFFILYRYTNHLTFFLAAVGFLVYVILYGVGKRRSIHGTIIGSISGAMPPVIGYCAVTNRFDSAAVILFLILVFWQMPHFYSIAMYRRKEYANADLPVLPVKKPALVTKTYILLYTIAFFLATLSLRIFGNAGWTYFMVALVAGLLWINLAIQGFKTNDDNRWARKIFRFSLIILLILCVMISVNFAIP